MSSSCLKKVKISPSLLLMSMHTFPSFTRSRFTASVTFSAFFPSPTRKRSLILYLVLEMSKERHWDSPSSTNDWKISSTSKVEKNSVFFSMIRTYSSISRSTPFSSSSPSPRFTTLYPFLVPICCLNSCFCLSKSYFLELRSDSFYCRLFSFSWSMSCFRRLNSACTYSRVATLGSVTQGWAAIYSMVSLFSGSNWSILVIKSLKLSEKNASPFGLFLACAFQKISSLLMQMSLKYGSSGIAFVKGGCWVSMMNNIIPHAKRSTSAPLYGRRRLISGAM
mmetsp:Transcript_27432/g.20578  ORF Transcript_27432/g.20578 Transcript_27432/m.20578 type:complete len:279 (+) Transcript_27432:81-917(+)